MEVGAIAAAPSTLPSAVVAAFCRDYGTLAFHTARLRLAGISRQTALETVASGEITQGMMNGVMGWGTLRVHLAAVQAIYDAPPRSPEAWRYAPHRVCLQTRLDPDKMLR